MTPLFWFDFILAPFAIAFAWQAWSYRKADAAFLAQARRQRDRVNRDNPTPIRYDLLATAGIDLSDWIVDISPFETPLR